jgi:hypothetical protein
MKLLKKILPFFILLSLALIVSKCVENHVLPSFARLFITSDPPGAQIYLNDKNTGKVTPDSLVELISGDYTVTLKYPAFNDSSFIIQLEDNESFDLDVFLSESNPQGEITLTSDPSGANIKINNEETGEVTPATFANLERGTYEIELSLNLYDDIGFTIQLDKDEKVNKNTRMIISGTSGSIFVNSDPTGAQIFLDGFDTGLTTPDTLKPLASGDYEIKLTLNEFSDTTFMSSVTTGITTVNNIFLRESNPQGEIELTSEPSGASISLNGAETGEVTPATFTNLERGTYEIDLTLDLYEDVNFILELSKDEKVSRNTKMLVSGSSGSIFITSSPSGAQIYLDEQNTGLVTPDTLKPLEPGNYDIKLTLDQYRDTTITTSVTAGTVTNANVVMTFYEPRGSISLDSNPQGAKIFLDGDDTEQVTPATIGKLEAGNYEIRLELEEYFDTTFTVQVIEDQNTNVPVVDLILIPYNIVVLISPDNSGVVTGGGPYNQGEQVVLQATPNTGYRFVSWTEEGNIIETDPQLEFEANSDRTITANFTLKTYLITAITNPDNAGTINGTGFYTHGDEVTLSITANENYRFVEWTEDGNFVSADQEYSFTATSDRDLVAEMEGLGNLIVSSDPIGANISLNNQFTNETTPHEFTDLVEGTYTVKLDLEDFADTVITAEVFAGVTTDLGSIFLIDTTSAVEVEITYREAPDFRFYFLFNQDIYLDRVEATDPLARFFQQPYNGQYYPEGIQADLRFPEKISGVWTFRIIGRKYGGRQDNFNVVETITVD